jgi:hypothetical protein
LSKLNNEIDAGSAKPDALVAAFLPLLREVQEKIGSLIRTRDEALMLIQLLGFWISSIERHSQRYAPPGSGIAQLPGAEDILAELGQIAKHLPRDSHVTYWIKNDTDTPLTFTGDRQEVNFNRAVNGINRSRIESNNALRDICRGDILLTSATALAALESATKNEWDILKLYQALWKHDTGGITPVFFMKQMRTYLTSYPIKGTLWSGANAANLPSQMQFDYLYGTVNVEYVHTVESRWRYLTPEDQEALKTDMSLPSVTERVLEHLGLTAQDVEKMSMYALAAHIAFAPIAAQTALIPYSKLFKAIHQATAYHFGLIKSHLIDAAKKLTPEEKAQLSVSPERGTGGKSHEETKAIMLMRSKHPVASKIATAVLNPFQLES